jgi:nucleoside-diphosphate-sugar epimerase
MSVPTTIRGEDELDDLLSEPSPGVVATMRQLAGDLIVLGVAGKMGLDFARMARRASDAAGVTRRIFGVSRFSSGGESTLRAHGIEPIRCDLFDASAVARLPDAGNVLYLAGRKFGSTGDEAGTWATNVYLPGVVCERFRQSRIVALSTGNVYGLVPADGSGSREEGSLHPIGEYAMSAVGRERIFEYFSRTHGTQVSLVRLNYACDLRYGVLVDVARRIWAGEPVDLGMGYFNTIWQGDAVAMALRAFDHAAAPPWIVNVTGPEVLRVRSVAERLSELMQKPVLFTGTESATALIADARRGIELLGPMRLETSRLIEWVADWVSHGGRSLGKPTHFESRDGRF